MSSTAPKTEKSLYLHGAGSICRNCGEHDSQHTSQFVPEYGYRAMVCPATDAPVNLKAARMAREQARWIRCWDKAGKPFAFGVPSQTQPGLYHLTNTRRCDCRGFQFSGHCVHIDAVRIVVKAAKLRKGIAA